jgi:hypothetical protein
MTTVDQPEFRLPHVDASAEAELGVVLMGMDVERLILALGFEALFSEPASVLLTVDHLIHHELATITAAQARAAAADAWKQASLRLPVIPHTNLSGNPREAWEHSLQAVRSALGEGRSATQYIYLAACWFRRSEVTRRFNESA